MGERCPEPTGEDGRFNSQVTDEDGGPAIIEGPQVRPSVVPERLQHLLDGLGRQAALVDCNGIVRSVNCHWLRAVKRHPETGLRVGESYTAFLRRLVDEGDQSVATILRAVEQICHGERWRFSTIYRGGFFNGHAFKVTASRIHLDHMRFAFVTVQDVTTLFENDRQMLEDQALFRQAWKS